MLKERVARRGKTSLSKVHQKLAKSGNICHIKTVPFEYNRVESSNYIIFLCDLARRLIKTRDCVIIQRRIYFIENNRLAKMPELESFGMVDENGAFLGGNCCFGLTVR